MLTAASCSSSSLCVMNLVIFCKYRYIYIAWLIFKGVFRYICIYVGHVFIYWALKQCLWLFIYVWWAYLWVCMFYACCKYAIRCKCMQMHFPLHITNLFSSLCQHRVLFKSHKGEWCKVLSWSVLREVTTFK